MKNVRKTITVIILTVVVFLSSVFLGVSAVFKVDTVWLDPITISEKSSEEVEEIYQKLLKSYKNKSYFSAKKQTAKDILAEYPYFRLTEFKKTYPDRVIVKIQEDEEVYAVPTQNEGEYYILGKTNTVLGIRNSYANRLDGKNNVLIKGLKLSGEKGGALTGDEIYPFLMTLCATFSQHLDGIRRNVIEIEVIKRPELIVCVTMSEGVKLYVDNVKELPEEKGKAVIEKYFSLSDENRLSGCIIVTAPSGKVNVAYRQEDLFKSLDAE